MGRLQFAFLAVPRSAAVAVAAALAFVASAPLSPRRVDMSRRIAIAAGTVLAFLAVIASALLPSPSAGAPDATTMESMSSDEVQGNDASRQPAVSDDGRFVAFASAADNLLSPGGDTNSEVDVF